MKIICSRCNKFIGEGEPYGDISTLNAKCIDCIKKYEGAEYVQRNQRMNYQVDSIDNPDAELRVVRGPRKRHSKGAIKTLRGR